MLARIHSGLLGLFSGRIGRFNGGETNLDSKIAAIASPSLEISLHENLQRVANLPMVAQREDLVQRTGGQTYLGAISKGLSRNLRMTADHTQNDRKMELRTLDKPRSVEGASLLNEQLPWLKVFC